MRIKALGHAGIAVRDLDASRAFYSGVLGMPIASVEPRRLALRASESELLLLNRTESTPPEAARANGVHHVAFLVGNTPMTLDEAARHLEAHRIRYERIAHEEHESLYCHDPDGHLVELYYWPSW
ncbi:MAG TPA: VOC family protein [Steroidobacteraceae bacterium]